MVFDTVDFKVAPTLKRVTNFLRVAEEFVRLPSVSAHRWQVLTGHMISLERFRPLSRLRLRHFQFWLNQKWDRALDAKKVLVPVPSFLKEALSWWLDQQAWLDGVSLAPSDPSLIIYSDASKLGWGAILKDQEASGLWSPQEAELHINSLELLAIWRALQHWYLLLKGKTVAVCSDNSTALSYLRNQGGDAFVLSLPPGGASPDLVVREGHPSPDPVREGAAQRPCRPAKQGRPSAAHGMDSFHPGLSGDLEALGHSPCRPVRDQEEQQASSVLFPLPGQSSMGSGCHATGLERQVPVCLPSIRHDQDCAQQVKRLQQLHIDSHYAMVAST